MIQRFRRLNDAHGRRLAGLCAQLRRATSAIAILLRSERSYVADLEAMVNLFLLLCLLYFFLDVKLLCACSCV